MNPVLDEWRRSVDRFPDAQDIAWAAGIWEGEGSVKSDNRHGTRYNISISVVSTDIEIVNGWRHVFGGNVFKKGEAGPGPDGYNRKAMYICAVTNSAVALGVITTILPHIRAQRRRDQLTTVLQRYADNPERAKTAWKTSVERYGPMGGRKIPERNASNGQFLKTHTALLGE